MSPDHNDVTLGEVYRLIVSMDKRLSESLSKVVGRDEYEADQEGINRRFEDSSKTHTALETKVAAVDAKYAAEIKDIRGTQEAQDKESRANRSKWIFAVVMAVASPVLAFIVNLIARGGA